MVLSALDAVTARHVFSCVWGKNGLLRGKTCLLVSGTSLEGQPAGNRIRFLEPGRLTSSELPTGSSGVTPSQLSEVDGCKINESIVVAESYTEHLEMASESIESARWYIGFGGKMVPLFAGLNLFLSVCSLLVQDTLIAMFSARVGDTLSPSHYVLTLLCIASSAIAIQLVYHMLAASYFVRVATDIHKLMVGSLFTAKSSFYDSTLHFMHRLNFHCPSCRSFASSWRVLLHQIVVEFC